MRKTLLACGVLLAAGASLATAQKITACGATFPDPIYEKWFSLYHTAHNDVEINYNANGSGGGVKGVTDGTVDFGASDMPMTDAELAAAKGKILHFPTVLGAVVPIYNIPGVTQELKFSGPTLAGIYLTRITQWNDKAIAADNPGVKLPKEDIVVVHRTDSSGTTFIFTDYLSKVSPEWKSKVGAAKAVSWPVGLGGAQNAGVTGLVKQTPNSIGYVELIFAIQNKLGYGLVKNASGEFVKAEHGIGFRGGRRCRDAGRLPRVHYQRDRQKSLPHLQLHLAVDPGQHSGCRQSQADPRVPALDVDRRTERSSGSCLRSAAEAGSGKRDEAACSTGRRGATGRGELPPRRVRTNCGSFLKRDPWLARLLSNK